MRSFTAVIDCAYHFLLENYGFVIITKRDNSDKYLSGKVEYQSQGTNIAFEKDGIDFSITIKPSGAPDISGMDVRRLLSILGNNTDDESAIISSRIYSDLLVEQFAIILQNKLDKYLRGDFSGWNRLLEINLEIIRKDYYPITGHELNNKYTVELMKYLHDSPE
jgi:hypothetical protein